MTHSPQEIARLAEGLTEPQRRAVLGARTLSSGGGVWSLRTALTAKGLVEGWEANWTPLGLALRAHLKEHAHGE